MATEARKGLSAFHVSLKPLASFHGRKANRMRSSVKSNFPFAIVRTRSKHGVKPVAPPIPLDQPGRLRIAHVLAIFAINKTTYYNRRNAGALPLPDGNDGRPFYYTSTIRPLVDGELAHL